MEFNLVINQVSYLQTNLAAETIIFEPLEVHIIGTELNFVESFYCHLVQLILDEHNSEKGQDIWKLMTPLPSITSE